jgi:Bacterial conjugation TrbI-like protein
LTRIIMPDGGSIVLERQPGADTQGYAGLEDEVDNHWGMLFKAAVLSTLLSVGAEAGTSQDKNNLVQAIRSGASNSISQTGSQIVQRQLNIQPTPNYPPRLPGPRDRHARLQTESDLASRSGWLSAKKATSMRSSRLRKSSVCSIHRQDEFRRPGTRGGAQSAWP